MAPKRTVEMRPAYAWTCDECGRDNFQNGIVPELSESDIAELREEHGVSSWETGYFLTYPDGVKCPHCGTEFETEGFGADE